MGFLFASDLSVTESKAVIEANKRLESKLKLKMAQKQLKGLKGNKLLKVKERKE